MREDTKSFRILKVLCVGFCELELNRLGFLFNGVDYDGYTYKLENLNDFQEARSYFLTNHPDLVLINDKFNRGLALCRFIRAHEGERHSGIVFTTHNESKSQGSETESSFSVECLNRGADEYIRLNTFNREFKARIRSIVRLKIMTDELRAANHMLRILSMTDDLTGVANMRSFYSFYNKMLKSTRSSADSFSLIMFDIDHFKAVNDTKSHLVGSHLLSEVGKILLNLDIPKKEGIVARFGGDEFVLCARDESIDQTLLRTEQLRCELAKHRFTYDEYEIEITASFGGAFIPKGFVLPSEVPLKIADANLYRSKNAGRNCSHVSICDDLRASEVQNIEQNSVYNNIKKKTG